MFGRFLRLVHDAWTPGAAERRLRQCERETRALQGETRQLLDEIQAVMEKMARQAATDARRRNRELEKLMVQQLTLEGGDSARAEQTQPRELTRDERKRQLWQRAPLARQREAAPDVVADASGESG